MVQANVSSVDQAQRPKFLLLCLQRWLGVVLDLLGAGVATAVVGLAVSLRGRGEVTGAQVGTALNLMLVANSTLLKLVESWTSLETSLGAVARLKTLQEVTPSETGKAGGLEPSENWPTRGCLDLRGITASYRCVATILPPKVQRALIESSLTCLFLPSFPVLGRWLSKT